MIIISSIKRSDWFDHENVIFNKKLLVKKFFQNDFLLVTEFITVKAA